MSRRNLLVTIIGCALLIGCGTKTVNNIAAPTPNSNGARPINVNPPTPISIPPPTARTVAPVEVKLGTPEAVVQDLYAKCQADDNNVPCPFFESKDRKVADKYFTRRTANKIFQYNYQADAKGDPPFDVNPLCVCQDSDPNPLVFNFRTTKIDGNKAEVIVSFVNFNMKENFIFHMVKEDNNWKIADIDYGEKLTLLKWIEGKV